MVDLVNYSALHCGGFLLLPAELSLPMLLIEEEYITHSCAPN